MTVSEVVDPCYIAIAHHPLGAVQAYAEAATLTGANYASNVLLLLLKKTLG